MDIIAEGVETKQQRQIILDNGCTNYQGYLFGKPMPIEQFDTLLALQDKAGSVNEPSSTATS
jgi:EAL domain-containing protein (putative c-di-GMP-specific phosphodiesterase class I)